MSGGTFDYKQSSISQIAQEIEDLIDYNPTNGGRDFSPETIERFAQAVDLLRRAYILVHRIDYLVAGDDGEDNFHQRLAEDMEKYRKWEGENENLAKLEKVNKP